MTTNQTTIDPSTIVRQLQSAPPGQPARVPLATVGAATIEAARNPYRSGFAVVVVSGGACYGVGGFKSRPGVAALAAAIDSARAYVASHAL